MTKARVYFEIRTLSYAGFVAFLAWSFPHMLGAASDTAMYVCADSVDFLGSSVPICLANRQRRHNVMALRRNDRNRSGRSAERTYGAGPRPRARFASR